MGAQLDYAKSRLFDEAALHVENIKLFPGSDRNATREAVAQEVTNALAQIESGDYDLIDQFED